MPIRPSNYGAIGATIGHEIGHGFDDQGRKFDPTGKLRDWWTPEAAKALHGHAPTRSSQQYDALRADPGPHINGKLTLGENIGDLGGSRPPMPPTAATSPSTASRR